MKIALEVLINLLDVLRSEGIGGQETNETTVDLSDIVAFTKEVKSTRIFAVVAQQLKINATEQDVKLLVVARHWQLVDGAGAARTVRRVRAAAVNWCCQLPGLGVLWVPTPAEVVKLVAEAKQIARLVEIGEEEEAPELAQVWVRH